MPALVVSALGLGLSLVGCGDDGGDGGLVATTVGFRAPFDPIRAEDGLSFSYRPAGADEDRTIPVAVWYPAVDDTGEAGPYQVSFIATDVGVKRFDATPRSDLGELPVAIYTHGSEATGILGYPYGEELAARGWLVLAPDHVGNTIADGTSPFAHNLTQRPQDLRALLDWVDDGGLPDDLDPLVSDRVMLFGHSWGNQAVLLLSGAEMDAAALRAAAVARIEATDRTREQKDEDLAELAAYLDDPEVAAALSGGFAEPRVRAFAMQSPAFVDLLVADSLADGVAPMMIQAAVRDTILPYDENVLPAWNGLDRPEDVRVDIANAGHYTFTTICSVLGGPLMPFLEILSGWDTNGCNPDLLPQEEAVLLMTDYLEAFGGLVLDQRRSGRRFLEGRPPNDDLTVVFRD